MGGLGKAFTEAFFAVLVTTVFTGSAVVTGFAVGFILTTIALGGCIHVSITW